MDGFALHAGGVIVTAAVEAAFKTGSAFVWLPRMTRRNPRDVPTTVRSQEGRLIGWLSV